MPKVTRCPYCIEGTVFKAMIAAAETGRFVCAECQHVAAMDDADYQCRCEKCQQLSGFPESRRGGSSGASKQTTK